MFIRFYSKLYHLILKGTKTVSPNINEKKSP